MPFTTIADAKEAEFPTTIDEAKLTIGQINRLAEFYDATKESGSADNPMAVVIAQWKEEHRKSDDEWVQAEVFEHEIEASMFDPTTHVIKAIRVGTVAHSKAGVPFVATKEWLQSHENDWTGGKLIANHYGANSKPHADIERSWFDGEFELMQLTNVHPDTDRRMMAGEHTGFSFDARGNPDNPNEMFGTNLSVLFYPHNPFCKPHEGCTIVADESQSLSDNIKIIGSESMGEKPYTDAEIDKLKTDSAANAARLATFEAEAKTHESGINALKAEIKLRSDKVSELTEVADGMFTAEAVEAKIAEAKGEMFSAEDVEAAKKEAIEVAIAAEKAKLESIAAELEVVSKMFPNGVDDAFKTEIVAMIKDGKSHEAFVKLGEVKFDSFKANIPTGSSEVGAEDDVPDNGFTVGDCKGV